MNRQEIYRFLEEKMLGYGDYASVPLNPTSEGLVTVPKNAALTACQIDTEMLPYIGNAIFVRWTVLQKLREASRLLQLESKDYQLEVVYGYRAPEVQRRLFEEHKRKLNGKVDADELIAATHRLIAVPDVAGHPTGGAVDVQILASGQPLDMDTKIWEFVPDSFTFSPFIGKEAWANRQVLRRVMTTVGFAPFDGEWWHFSYGDKEWAKFYNQSEAIYDQIEFTAKTVEVGSA
jgi:D-alanyl-D-alanine dipeptidase